MACEKKSVWVSGIGIVSAIGIGVEANFASLLACRDGMGLVTLFDTIHKVPVGEVKASNRQLAEMLGLPADKTYSRTALLGMMAAGEALRDSGVCEDSGADPGLRIGLISATSVAGMDLTEDFYREFVKDNSKGRLRMAAQHDCFDSTDKIARHCGITHFSTTISTACSSAANAVMLGDRLIRAGMLDCVVVGGTDALSRFTINGFKSLMILDEQRCRPFDASRAGLNLGEGAGYIVLQSEATLSRRPYCRLAGYANANDAFHQTASSENGEGAFLAMRRALDMAGLHTADIDYINVHGTGTPNNDASEGAAMRRIWGDTVPPFSSTKPFTGHALAAAGGIEAVFSTLAIERGAVYPTLNFSATETGLVPATTLLTGQDIKAVLSNSFGFGGNNSSLIFTV